MHDVCIQGSCDMRNLQCLKPRNIITATAPYSLCLSPNNIRYWFPDVTSNGSGAQEAVAALWQNPSPWKIKLSLPKYCYGCQWFPVAPTAGEIDIPIALASPSRGPASNSKNIVTTTIAFVNPSRSSINPPPVIPGMAWRAPSHI